MVFEFSLSEARYFCGLLAGALSLMAFAPYIRDTLRGRSKPLRSSWLIWSVLASVAFVSQAAEGASASLWFAAAQTSGTLAVALLSVRRGAGVYLTGRDGAALVAAALGLGLWALTSSAVWALGITIAISVLAGAMTVCKSFRAPQTETMSTWGLSFAASCLALASAGSAAPVILAYPAYLFVLNASIMLALFLGRRQSARTAPVFAARPYPVRAASRNAALSADVTRPIAARRPVAA